ncbi:uncharacterized protein LOC62_04G005605 [Vanrija pseudolonga]|uniref:Uncharacterized protein n=1 Tax=Vanrija pseudolonga TaxID=143232 RepID=A0AAF0YEM3_9TREE|nr:hypothetical protein LOC62_04G005605 [Vanrija pseudolonga]
MVQPVPVPQPAATVTHNVQPTSTDVTPRQAPGPLPTQTTPRASPVPPAASVQQRDLKSPVDLNGVRSPTPPSSLGRLTPEPKQGPGYSGLGNGLPTSMGGSPLPPRVLSATNQARRIASSPLASPVFSNPSSPINGINGIAAAQARSASASAAQARITPMSPNDSGGSAESAVAPASKPNSVRSSVLNRPRPRAKHLDRSLTALLVHPHITASLLPHININTFLNVLGSDDTLRKYISGEMVGRWVMREWGVTVERERGRSWPGLTVWEGFLESLLHDPAVYSTYPQQYHNLLRHLSLSHTLIVLFLRTLPPSAFPYSPPLPFDDELQLPTLHKSSSMASMQGGRYPGSRTTSNAGSDAGHGGGHSISRMPRGERVTEVVMPEPLSSTPKEVKTLHDSAPPSNFGPGKLRKRRGSAGSVTSIGSTGFFGRKRSASVSSAQNVALASPAAAAQPALPVPQGKAAFPPVSYPTAKRYEFRRYGDQPISPSPSAPNSRPGSIMSAQTSPSVVRGSTRNGRHQHGSIGQGMSDLGHGSDSLPVPPPIGGDRQNRSSLTSSEGRSSRGGANSPVHRRYESPTGSSRDLSSQMSHRAEPAFDRPPPFMPGRAPILRVFIPVSDRVPRWPSAEGAAASWRELEKCGADKRMKLGDLVVNTALHKPTNTEHVLVYVPFVAHKLVPLEYVHSPTGHLPRYLDAFAVSPVYYDPFLPAPQILYLDFAPYAQQAMNSLRLAYDRRDVTVASGARLSAKRYLHVAGLEIRPGDRVAADWQGMVTLEAEGTAEGKAEMEARFGRGDPTRAVMGPWEVVRERSLLGSLWLRLVREPRGN